MRRLRSEAGMSSISLIVSLLIGFALLALYLKEVTPGGPKGGVPGTALDAARNQAQHFEAEQKKRLEQMDQIAQ